MKTALVRVLSVLFFFVFAKFADAGDFVSQVLQITDNPITISVSADRFLVIRNFTQVGPLAMGQMRGSVSVTSPFTATVLTATIVDPSSATLEPVNNIVIAGPSTVTVNPGSNTCFITYRKGTD